MPPTVVEPEIILESTTESQAELDHATGPDRREHFDPDKAKENKTEESKETKSAAASETANAGSKKGESEAEEDANLPPGARKRIDKLTAKLRQTEAERDELRGKREKPATVESAKPAADPEPVLKDFKSWEEWNAAHTRWNVREELRETNAKAEKEQRLAEAKETYDAHLSRVKEARTTHADFDEAVKAMPMVHFRNAEANQAFQMAIVEADNSAEIMYHLAKHPEEMAKFEDLSPVRVQLLVGKISAALSPSTAEHKTAPVTPVSRTPAPPTTLRGTSSAPASSVYDEKISTDEYIRRRTNQQRANRRN
jgi:hypothetical protein